MSTMFDEQHIERLALLGTAQAADTIVLPDGLQRAPEGRSDHREHDLLLALGTASLMRKAGQLPVAHDTFPAWSAAPHEVIPALGATGEQCLRAILEEEDSELLSSYLAQLASKARRVPPAFIVPLIGLAARQRELQQRVLVQAGARGVWLAQLDPALSTMLHADAGSGDRWNTGTLAQRAAHLVDMRQRDPVQARDLLAAGIKQESSKDLPTLLEALSTGLSLADAPLIEPLVKSKAREVRATATALIARMPGHPSQEALFSLCSAHLESKGNMIMGRRLEVSLPEAYDAAWAAYGIEPKSARYPTERTAWLGQMIAHVHPKRWCDRFDRSEEDLVALAQKNEFSAMLLAATADAALLHEHQPMISALLRAGLNVDDPAVWQQLRLTELWAAVDSTCAEAVLMPVVDRWVASGEVNDRLAWLLHANTRDWSPKLAGRVLDWVERIAPEPDDAFNWSQAHQLFNALGRSTPTLLRDRVDAITTKLREVAAPAYLKLLEQLAKRLRLRQRMLDSLNEHPPTL